MKGRKIQREEEGELESMEGSCRRRRLCGGKDEKDVDKEIFTARQRKIEMTLKPGNKESDNMLNRHRKY